MNCAEDDEPNMAALMYQTPSRIKASIGTQLVLTTPPHKVGRRFISSSYHLILSSSDLVKLPLGYFLEISFKREAEEKSREGQ